VRRVWAAAALLAACGPAAPGAVSGDAFLVEDVGREIDLAGIRVRLIPEEEMLDSTLARVCPTRSGIPADPGAAQRRAWTARAGILRPRVRAETRANGDARFAFGGVAPGRYRLWADTVIDSVRWTWLQPVTIAPAETARVELNNANPDENPFRCGPRESGPTPLTVKGR
jgi:hypothetical protein